MAGRRASDARSASRPSTPAGELVPISAATGSVAPSVERLGVLMTLIEAIGNEGEALATAAERAGVESQVPTCPEWRLADLLAHVGLFTSQLLGRQWAGDNPNDVTHPGLPPETERIAWYREISGDMTDALNRSTTPGSPTDGIAQHLIDDPLGFAGMLAREVPVHRWDAENAAGAARPLDDVIAAAALTTMFENFLPMMWGRAAGEGQSALFAATDLPLRWLVTFTSAGASFQAASETDSADVDVRGTASDLHLTLWQRAGGGTVRVEGDRAVLGIPFRRPPQTA